MVKRENMGHLQNNLYDKQFPTRGQNEEQRKQFAKEDSTKLVAQEIEKLEIILSKRRQEYDALTNYGQNQKKTIRIRFNFSKTTIVISSIVF